MKSCRRGCGLVGRMELQVQRAKKHFKMECCGLVYIRDRLVPRMKMEMEELIQQVALIVSLGSASKT